MLRVLIVAALRHLAALSCPSVTLRYFLLLCCAACHFMFPVFASVLAVKLFFIMTSLFFLFSLLAAKYRPYGVYRDSRSTLVIHNLAHQVWVYHFSLSVQGFVSQLTLMVKPYVLSMSLGCGACKYIS
jgi:hypothetical protein